MSQKIVSSREITGLREALRPGRSAGRGTTAGNPTSTSPPTPLYRISEIDAERPDARDLAPLQRIARWVREYLAKPHPDLGRSGPVCPFVPTSLRLDTLFLTCIHLGEDCDPGDVEAVASTYRAVFLDLEPRSGDEAVNKAVMMVFPDISDHAAPRLIDAVQKRLKADYTRCGLMIGEFHASNPTLGLRSDRIKPLQSPLPMLVIRHMVESDLPFLERDEDPAGARVGFLRAYLRRLGGQVSDRKLDAAIDALVDAEIELRQVAPDPGTTGCPVAH